MNFGVTQISLFNGLELHVKFGGGGYGIHWRDTDEDLSTGGLLRSAPTPGWRQKIAAG